MTPVKFEPTPRRSYPLQCITVYRSASQGPKKLLIKKKMTIFCNYHVWISYNLIRLDAFYLIFFIFIVTEQCVSIPSYWNSFVIFIYGHWTFNQFSLKKRGFALKQRVLKSWLNSSELWNKHFLIRLLLKLVNLICCYQKWQ